MKKYLLILFVAILYSVTDVSAQYFCGTSPHQTNTLSSYSASKKLGANLVVDNCTNITVNLQFHIIRNTDGSGGQPNSIVNTILSNLASSYNQWGI